MSPDGDAKHGRVVVFAAPSGAGKTTIIHRVMETLPNLVFSVSSTTRPRRQGEVDGIDYDFLSEEEFDAAIEAGDFIEWERVHGFRYGTRKSRVDPLLQGGRDVVFDLDVLGALTIKGLYPGALLLYIDVLSRNVLRERLLARGREDAEEIERRLHRYDMEKEAASRFDVVVINDDLERATREVVSVIRRYREGRMNVT